MSVFTNTELVAIFAEKQGTTKKAAKENLDLTFATLSEIVKEYGVGIKMGDFGNLPVVDVPERTHRNPQDGSEVVKPAHKAIKFKAGKGENSVKKALETLEV